MIHMAHVVVAVWFAHKGLLVVILKVEQLVVDGTTSTQSWSH